MFLFCAQTLVSGETLAVLLGLIRVFSVLCFGYSIWYSFNSDTYIIICSVLWRDMFLYETPCTLIVIEVSLLVVLMQLLFKIMRINVFFSLLFVVSGFFNDV